MRFECSECDYTETFTGDIKTECPNCKEKEFINYFNELDGDSVEFIDDVVELYNFYKSTHLTSDISYDLVVFIWRSWSDKVDASWLCLMPSDFMNAYTYYYKMEYTYLKNKEERKKTDFNNKVKDKELCNNLLEYWTDYLKECKTDNDYMRLLTMISRLETSYDYWSNV